MCDTLSHSSDIDILFTHAQENAEVSPHNEQINLIHIPINTLHPRSISPTSFCVDIVVLRLCIGLKQYRRILHVHNRRSMTGVASNRTFQFCNHSVQSLGMVEMSLHTPDHVQTIPVLLEIVPFDVPALLGLDILDGYSLLADNVNSRMWHRFVTSKDHLEYTMCARYNFFE